MNIIFGLILIGDRALWFALMILASIMIGSATGLLAWVGGDTVAAAILEDGGTTGGSLALMLALFHFLASGK
ncbi:hypothetical protein [Couchioplanes caeruleus]|uniref:Uncharacterized protein n=2 Tax=Couchioplanes caeruleus TaxID=56438 RepID=A0A1K0G077_9ACTN|nr:hypothetical protein [Couchioplanes caeruleus]OJF10714.1 hypothetical protein BG844_30555 [Couchioplanes caeruleus subsp. caeruleus]ROP28180.1 hypothetical protein EDD30_0895 [Couchioplanes caeruleus]